MTTAVSHAASDALAAKVTIAAEHVPVLREDLRDQLATEADNIVISKQAELQGYETRGEDITAAMRQMHRLTGLLAELGFAHRARERAVTLTAGVEVLGRHCREQLVELDACLGEATVGGECPDDMNDMLELHVAMRHVLAQIPAEPVAA